MSEAIELGRLSSTGKGNGNSLANSKKNKVSSSAPMLNAKPLTPKPERTTIPLAPPSETSKVTEYSMVIRYASGMFYVPRASSDESPPQQQQQQQDGQEQQKVLLYPPFMRKSDFNTKVTNLNIELKVESKNLPKKFQYIKDFGLVLVIFVVGQHLIKMHLQSQQPEASPSLMRGGDINTETLYIWNNTAQWAGLCIGVFMLLFALPVFGVYLYKTDKALTQLERKASNLMIENSEMVGSRAKWFMEPNGSGVKRFLCPVFGIPCISYDLLLQKQPKVGGGAMASTLTLDQLSVGEDFAGKKWSSLMNLN